MEVLLLGTGSAEGWPNPFCTCASCQGARAAGEIRGQTAALVDGTVLLDCGPEAPRAAERAGRPLSAVRHVLVTHDHPDHCGPAALLWRHWAGRREPVEVLGPEPALATCREWLAPGDPVTLRAVRPLDRVPLGDYEARALPAEHHVPTLLWDLTGPDGTRVLYATDTGPLPQETVDAATGRAYDLVLLEETFGDQPDHRTGHLDLTTFPRELARLRACGAVTERTRIVAVHLGHRNPPPPELDRRLAVWGAESVPDGTVLSVGGGSVAPMRPPPGRALVLGGARSGKSAEAERRLAAHPTVVYLATGGERPDDPEWLTRVAEHQARRPPGWATVETTDPVPLLEQPGPPVLLDCLALWLTGVLDRCDAWDEAAWRAGGEDAVRTEITRLVEAVRATPRPLVLVSNEVGSGIVPATASGRRFRDELGRLNARVGAECDEVVLVVAGHAVPLKSRPTAGARNASRPAEEPAWRST